MEGAGVHRKIIYLNKTLKEDNSKSKVALSSFIKFTGFDARKVTALFRITTTKGEEVPKWKDGYCSTIPKKDSIPGKHAEECVIEKVEEHMIGKRPIQSTLEMMLSHSPCMFCREKLTDMFRKIPGEKTFILRVASIYTRLEVDGTPIENLGKWLASLEMEGVNVKIRPVDVARELNSSESKLRRRFGGSKWTEQKKGELEKQAEKVAEKLRTVREIQGEEIRFLKEIIRSYKVLKRELASGRALSGKVKK